MSTTTTEPDLAVVIPHYNDADRLDLCLAALQKNDLRGVEIVVVDNDSPTPPDRLQPKYPDVRFVTETTKGAGPARNRGVAETTAPVLAFLDADCIPDPDWISVARAVAPTADLIGGRMDVFYETPAPNTGSEAFEKVFAFDQRTYVEVQGFSATANLVTSRAVFEDVGPFRALVSEDNDWCYRATDKGYRIVYADHLRISHPARPDWASLRGRWRRTTQEGYALLLDQRPGLPGKSRWALKALAMPASAVVHLPRLLFSPKLATPGERVRGAGTLFRLRLLRMVWMLRQVAGAEI